ncbi:hypothetical protein AB751O23_AQ_00080 [Chlamydiales bacterium SCGC AB-751-O23]|jgi:uncharacterized protein|nr:hypothetical protein AB751O23_AQ_00080 [Chlamydiales bacterium SCGC AB-751-O23]
MSNKQNCFSSFTFLNQYEVDPDNLPSFKKIKFKDFSLRGTKKFLQHIRKIKNYKHESEYESLELVKHPKMGYGVEAKKLIKKGEIISHYAGEICSSIKANLDHLDNGYLFTLAGCGVPRFRKWLINAQDKGNISRFINHSQKNANLSLEIRLLPSEELEKPFPYIFFIASEDIKPGEQLFYDYGNGYWKDLGITPHEE